MEKVIVQLVFDLFHLESHLVSGAYGGERFGKGIYYHLVYGHGEDEKKLEVLMVFEDRALINTVGKVMGIQTNKLDDMLIHAARYTARQFVSRVMEHFPALDGYELREENLLLFDQFKKMQTSLLFDTGAGYFAFCLIAPHLLKKGVGTPIQNENAMSEVEEYLARRKTQEKRDGKKPKVLVVDDSATIRQGMKPSAPSPWSRRTWCCWTTRCRCATASRPWRCSARTRLLRTPPLSSSPAAGTPRA